MARYVLDFFKIIIKKNKLVHRPFVRQSVPAIFPGRIWALENKWKYLRRTNIANDLMSCLI